MKKETLKKIFTMTTGALAIALLVSIIPGSFLAEASKDLKAGKSTVEVINVDRDVFQALKTNNSISLETAESVALKRVKNDTAKITAINVVKIKNKLHYIIDVTTYHIKINKVFKVKIDGITGNIKGVDVETEKIKDDVKDDKDKTKDEEKYITKEEAIKIALKKIGTDAKLDEIEFEKDDNPPKYELEMYDDEYEYEIEIHAITGAILDFEKELD